MQHRSLFVMGIRLFQLTLMAFVVATLFLQTPQGTVADGQIYFSVIFFSVLFMIMGAIGEMHMLVERMAVVYRQRDALFYPGWCFALPAFVMRLPWAVMETSAWSLIVYFAVGFSSSVRFLMFCCTRVVAANMERISQATEASAAYREHTAIKFEPIWMTFRDVEYSVPVPRDTDTSKVDVPVKGPHAGQLRLLYKVSGVFRPQVLCALMGASGAGKTTLMDVLAGRKTGGVITGAVHLNGFPKDQATFARLSGYVEQIMELVDLADLRHAHVGRPGVSGLSVEQRKRLTIAVELAANPSIVFMVGAGVGVHGWDEPTSGLDARAANIVMRTIRDTVDTGRTCVCTIHQPSVDIFEVRGCCL
eukprot:scaffold17.g586.t1